MKPPPLHSLWRFVAEGDDGHIWRVEQVMPWGIVIATEGDADCRIVGADWFGMQLREIKGAFA